MSIIWIEEDKEGILNPYKEALVKKANVANRELNKILVDLGTLVDVLFKYTLEEMEIIDIRLEHTNTPIKELGEKD